MSITIVQKGTQVNQSASLTAAITLTGCTAGNALIFCVSHEDSGGAAGQSVTASDNVGGSLTPDITNTRGNQAWAGVYSLWNIASGSHTITATSAVGTAGNSSFVINVMEVSGLGTSNSFDKSSGNNANTSTTPTTGTTSTLAQASELVVCVVALNTNTTGWTVPPTGGNNSPYVSIYSHTTTCCGDADYQINTSSTTGVAAAWGTLGTSQIWSAVIGTYKAAQLLAFRKTLSPIGTRTGSRQIQL
jgi:hypothetical protein